MGRPLKTKVSETSATDQYAVVTRVAKKLKSFSKETLLAAVVKSFQKIENEGQRVSLANEVDNYLTHEESKYTVANGVYTVIPGKRGRPRKTAEVAATAV